MSPVKNFIMYFLSLILFTTTIINGALASSSNLQVIRSLDNLPVLHLTISRRGGPFEVLGLGHEVANFTYLTEELEKVEQRFNLTRREVKGNKLVRKAKQNNGGGDELSSLTGQVSEHGRW